MNRRNLTSLGNSIRSVVAESIDTETKTNLISEGYINSLTEKARQTASQEMEEEGEDEEDLALCGCEDGTGDVLNPAVSAEFNGSDHCMDDEQDEQQPMADGKLGDRADPGE